MTLRSLRAAFGRPRAPLPVAFGRARLSVVGVAWLTACGGSPCEEGFGEGADGNCYPIATGTDTPTVDTDTEDTVETDLPVDTAPTESGYHYEPCPDGIYAGPTLIAEATVICDAADYVRYYVDTDGWTANGRVFSQETGVVAVPYPQWADEHDVLSYEFDACQFWDHLEQVLETEVSLADWVPDQSTIFTCSGHFEAAGVMTYAVQVDDLDGNPADCVAFGDNPAGLINGTAGDRVNDPSFALSACGIGVAAR